MQFINIVVHSVENMNFRVHLQYEFTRHGLDDYLEVSLTFDLIVIQSLKSNIFYYPAVLTFFTQRKLNFAFVTCE